MVNRIYMDHGATTPVHPRVLEAMLPYFSEHYGNPSSVYREGHRGKQAVAQSRAAVAKLMGCADSREIYFTSGGTEADNWAIKGYALKHCHKGKHLITTSIEHHAVLNAFKVLEEKAGFEVTYLPVDEKGFVHLSDLQNALREDTILVSVMLANNEVGTIQPVQAIGELLEERGVAFHTDAVQAFGAIPIDVQAMHIDMLSVSAHKMYGPKGVGALYVRKGIVLENLLSGGNQERSRRAGTENVPGIVGFGVACDLSHNAFELVNQRMTTLRNALIDGVLTEIPDVTLNGDPWARLPGNAHFCLEGLQGEALLTSLDMAGIAASSGSACTSGSLNPSHVLLAMGIPEDRALGSLRLTLGRDTTKAEIEETICRLSNIVERLRSL